MGSSESALPVIGCGHDPVDRVTAAIIAELRRQEPSDGQFFYVEASNPAAVVIDATIDLEAVARVVIKAMTPPL
jgi:hypothetical protein